MKKLAACIRIPLLLLSLPLGIQDGFGQTPVRLGLFWTDADLVTWRARANSGPYKVQGDVSTNSPGDWTRVNANANSFRSNPANDRYDNTVYKGDGYVPRSSAYDPHAPNGKSAGIWLRDCAFRWLIKQQTADATAVIAELKRIVDQPFSTTDSRKCFDWNDAGRWGRVKPYYFQDTNPGFGIAEWLNRFLFAADMVRSEMSGADSTKIFQWISDAAYYMTYNFEPDANALFVNRAAGNYSPRPGYDYSRETDNADVKQLYSTASVVGPKAHYITRHYSNRRLGMAYFVGAAGIALGDAYLIGIGKRWMREMERFAINPLGDYVDLFRSISDKSVQKGPGYSHLSGLYSFADMLALTGDYSLYLDPEVLGSLITSGPDAFGDGTTPKTPFSQIKRLCDIRNHVVNIYASLTPTSDVSKRMDGSGTIIDGLFAIANRFYRNGYIDSTYHRTASGAVPYPANPTPSGSDVAASVLANLPAVFLMYAGLENANDRYRQSVTDPGGDTTEVPPPPPPPPIVSHWADFSDTITITAPTQFLNYSKEKALVHGDTIGISSRFVTNHTGNDTLSYVFNSPRGLDSLSVVTGRDRFDPEPSYRIEYLNSGSWSSLVDETANTATTRLYNVNVGSADAVRFIWRKNTDYTRVKEAGVKITSVF